MRILAIDSSGLVATVAVVEEENENFQNDCRVYDQL